MPLRLDGAERRSLARPVGERGEPGRAQLGRGATVAGQPAQDGRQDPAVAVVVDLDRAVEPGDRLERAAPAPSSARADDRQPLARGDEPARRGRAIVYVSRPVRPSEAALSPGRNWSGRTPIPTRLERWIRS